MGHFYQHLIRPILFNLDPEKAHHMGMRSLRVIGKVPGLTGMMESWNQSTIAHRPVRLFGLDFPNRVGLAAGFDKNGEVWPLVGALGFGHAEIGTVTAEAQSGNSKPRMFRLPDTGGLVNRMGFNNEGPEAVAERLSHQGRPGDRPVILGINLGKSKVTPLEEAVKDYRKSFRLLAPHADYITINVSSPNTPGLRSLQEAGPLRELLQALQTDNQERATGKGSVPLPILLKIAPDLTFAQLDEIVGIVEECQISGIIATNTTIQRTGDLAEVRTDGGLSGGPIYPLSYRVVHYLARLTKGRLPIIAVGGIDSEFRAGAMMDAGASLVQVYSGLVYEGPFLAARLAWALQGRDKDWI